MKKIILFITVCGIMACTNKLDLKPSSSLVLPTTVKDFENLLDNAGIINEGTGLQQISGDEYVIASLADFQAIRDLVSKSACTWETDIFNGASKIKDWTLPYSQIFICNSILDILAKQGFRNDPEKARIKGWALFVRAYAFYTLTSTFAAAYDSGSANTDLGIPLKLNSSVTDIVQRSTLQESYDRIIKDALDASELLQKDIPFDKKNRPSKTAAYALLARVFTSMREYVQAEIYVDKSLALYSALTDYNTLPIVRYSSFTGFNSEEVIYFVKNLNYSSLTSGAGYAVNPALLDLYDESDLRKQIYFRPSSLNINNYIFKGINNDNNGAFTGLAVDEMYLIKAECLARRNQKDEALSVLNKLVNTRYTIGTFVEISASNSTDALDKILTERRKSMPWRSTRWSDLKRLNLEGYNIKLIRNVGETTYTLEPNDPKYVLPIPNDEIALSAIKQNIR